MAKLYQGIQFKMTIGFILLISIVVGTTFYLMVSQGKHAVKEQMREELMHTASLFASQINGDVMGSLNPGDENKTEFWDIVHQLKEMKGTNSQIVYAYTMKVESPQEVKFIVDEDGMESYEKLLSVDGTFEGNKIGDTYDNPPIEDILIANEKPWATKDPYTDEWGTFMTGYAPIKNSKGDVVAIIGVDMDISTVTAKQDFLSSLVYYVIAMAVIFSVALVFYFSTTITRPVIKLKEAADKVTSGIDAPLPSIKRNDEIADLTSSLEMLITAFKFAKNNNSKGGKK